MQTGLSSIIIVTANFRLLYACGHNQHPACYNQINHNELVARSRSKLCLHHWKVPKSSTGYNGSKTWGNISTNESIAVAPTSYLNYKTKYILFNHRFKVFLKRKKSQGFHIFIIQSSAMVATKFLWGWCVMPMTSFSCTCKIQGISCHVFSYIG